MMKIKNIIYILLVLSAAVLAEDKGLKLGETEYFSASGEFSINLKKQSGGVKISWPDLTAALTVRAKIELMKQRTLSRLVG